jgi:hypothetical protein
MCVQYRNNFVFQSFPSVDGEIHACGTRGYRGQSILYSECLGQAAGSSHTMASDKGGHFQT